MPIHCNFFCYKMLCTTFSFFRWYIHVYKHVINIPLQKVDNMFVSFLWERSSRYSSGYKECILLFSYEAELIKSLVSARKKQHLGSISRIGSSIITQTLQIIWTRCILLNLRPKTHQRGTLLFLTQIYYCRSRGTVKFTLSFQTNAAISISISNTFRFWVVMFRIRGLWRFISHLYDMPGLAPHISIYSEDQTTFQ